MPEPTTTPYSLKIAGEPYTIRRWEGFERVSSLFQYRVTFESESPDLALKDFIGQMSELALAWRSGGPDGEEKERSICGIVSRATEKAITDTRGRGKRTIYEVEIVPRLYTLTLRRDCRIFQDKKTDEIITEVLKGHGLKSADVDKKIKGNCRKHTYCVQYRETDLAFVSRLLEAEGIAYFFDFKNGKDIWVLANSLKLHLDCDPEKEVQFHRATGQDIDRSFAHECEYLEQMVSGTASLQDFNFEKSQTSLYSEKEGKLFPHLDVYDYPGDYTEKGDGKELTNTRLEELGSEEKVLSGRGNCHYLCAGKKFTLKDHYREELNDKEYVVLEVRHHGDVSGTLDGVGETGYENSFSAIPATVPYRPARTTPRPVVEGPQTAIVVGPSGEEIYPDKYGRVKVRFHWDRLGKADEKSSCWVRVAQVWAGRNWGAMYIPRIGQEVIVEFLEGDPDNPIITGRVYNDHTMPPYGLPDNKTMSTLKSNSSKGGKGFNEIRFEDKKGEEQIFVHAEKNQDVRVKKDCFEWIGNKRHLIVKKDQIEHVENNRHEKVDADHKEEIGKDRHLKIKGKEAKEVGGSHSFTVKGDVIEAFKGNHSEQTTRNLYLKAMGIVIEAMQGITLKCGAGSVVIDPAGVTLKGAMVTIDGAMTKINSGPGSPPTAGTAGSAVSPAAPDKAEEADDADPGKVAKVKAEQIKKKEGKYGAPETKPHKPSEEEEEKKSWIEIELVDEEDNPVPGERYKVTMPDGETVAEGTLDDKGFAHIDGVDPGTCKITFPNLDKEAWKKA